MIFLNKTPMTLGNMRANGVRSRLVPRGRDCDHFRFFLKKNSGEDESCRQLHSHND